GEREQQRALERPGLSPTSQQQRETLGCVRPQRRHDERPYPDRAGEDTEREALRARRQVLPRSRRQPQAEKLHRRARAEGGGVGPRRRRRGAPRAQGEERGQRARRRRRQPAEDEHGGTRPGRAARLVHWLEEQERRRDREPWLRVDRVQPDLVGERAEE